MKFIVLLSLPLFHSAPTTGKPPRPAKKTDLNAIAEDDSFHSAQSQLSNSSPDEPETQPIQRSSSWSNWLLNLQKPVSAAPTATNTASIPKTSSISRRFGSSVDVRNPASQLSSGPQIPRPASADNVRRPPPGVPKTPITPLSRTNGTSMDTSQGRTPAGSRKAPTSSAPAGKRVNVADSGSQSSRQSSRASIPRPAGKDNVRPPNANPPGSGRGPIAPAPQRMDRDTIHRIPFVDEEGNVDCPRCVGVPWECLQQGVLALCNEGRCPGGAETVNCVFEGIETCVCCPCTTAAAIAEGNNAAGNSAQAFRDFFTFN